MSTSIIEKTIIRPVEKELVYRLLYDVATLFSSIKSFRLTARNLEVNEISGYWAERSLFAGVSLPIKVKGEVISEDTVVNHLESQGFKARIEYKIVPVFYAVHINVRGQCEGDTSTCTRIVNSFLKELENLLKKPPQPVLTPPKPAPRAQPAKTAAPPQPPAVQPPQLASQPPPATREVVPDVSRFFDEVAIAMMLFNSELISVGELEPPWAVSTLMEGIKEKAGSLSQYKLGLVTLKDDGVDIVVFVDQRGEPLGLFGRIESSVIRGAQSDLNLLEKYLSTRRIAYRIWGVRQLPP